MFEANLGLNYFYIAKLCKYSKVAENSAFSFCRWKKKDIFKKYVVLKRCWDGLLRTRRFEDLKYKDSWNFKGLSHPEFLRHLRFITDWTWRWLCPNHGPWTGQKSRISLKQWISYRCGVKELKKLKEAASPSAELRTLQSKSINQELTVNF